MANDQNLGCDGITRQIQANNEAMVMRAQEGEDVTGRNIMVGAVGLLLFWPMLFAIDAKDAAGIEARAFEVRSRTLEQQGRLAGCQVPAVYSTADAERILTERKQTGSEVTTVASKDSDTAANAAQLATAPPTSQPTSPSSNGDGNLRDLMDRFLKGEIDVSEYNRQRALLNGN